MEPIEWNNEKMSIGIKLIDDEHKVLLGIINQLSTSITEQSQKNDILIIINKLMDYASHHFKTEERLFEKFDYIEADIHLKEHSAFSEKFIEIKHKFEIDSLYLRRNSIEIAEDIFTYIIVWFLKHVNGSDRKYVKLFQDHGIE